MKKSLITLLVTGLLAANARAAGQDNTGMAVPNWVGPTSTALMKAMP